MLWCVGGGRGWRGVQEGSYWFGFVYSKVFDFLNELHTS